MTGVGDRRRRVGGGLSGSLALLTVLFSTISLTAVAGPAAAAGVRTAVNPSRSGELVKTVPISKRPWQQTRSVMSLGPDQLGRLNPGEAIEAASDVETTICIRPNPRHPGKGQPCVGRYYDFNPKIKTKLVLASSSKETSPKRTLSVSRTFNYTCTERPRHRTRHCVQTIPWSKRSLDQPIETRCGDDCHLNLLVSAFSPRAGRDQKVVVGSSDDDKRIMQGRSQLSAIVYDSEAAGGSPQQTRVTKALATKRPPVAAKGKSLKERVIYSQKITGAQAGDQYVVDAHPWVKNTDLPYPTRAQYWIVASDSPTGTKQNNRLTQRLGPVSVSNGFTCTHNASGHRSPCGTVKTGIISADNPQTFYVNLVLGQEARGVAPQYRRWRPSDRTKMLSRGFMRVREYQGVMSCKSCSDSHGFTYFTPDRPPVDPRIAKLVDELAGFDLTVGLYECFSNRGAAGFVCSWRATGSFLGGGDYECRERAFYVNGDWRIKPCLEVVTAKLREIITSRGDRADFVGECGEIDANTGVSCRWLARDGATGEPCGGQATFSLDDDLWRIEPC